MRKKLTLFVVFLAIAAIPTLAGAADAVEGSVQGFRCVTEGKVCPVGKEDPLAAVERVFVLHVSGKDYYFVPNVDRAVLARHINRPVKIKGSVDKEDKIIMAKEIYAKENGKWEEVWSKAMEDKMYQDAFSW
jgi:hypothetical protein